jgi:S-adenosylmethionine/arginine decarboxylase-like enzyme
LDSLYGVLFEDDNKNNKLEILEYVNDKNLGSISFITHEQFDRDILENRLLYKSTFILQNLMFLGDTLVEILKNIEFLLSNHITIHTLNPECEISILTCKAQTFSKALLYSEELLYKKRLEKRRAKSLKNGIKVGRKTGVLVRSKFDTHREKIEELYKLGLSMKKIVEHINVGTQQSLYHYIKSRGITKS